MSILGHDMTPREPYDPSLRKSESWHDFAPDHRLRHLTVSSKQGESTFDIRRGNLGDRQSLDGQPINFEDSAHGKATRAISRSSSTDSFYLGSGTWQNDRKPRGIRDLGSLFNDANDPRIATRKSESRDELLYYEAKQKQERAMLNEKLRNLGAADQHSTGLILETRYSRTNSRRSSAGSISGFGYNGGHTAEDAQRKAEGQSKYASELEEQIRTIRAEKARLQIEDMVTSSKLASEQFVKSNSRNPTSGKYASKLVSRTVYDPEKANAYHQELSRQVQQRDAERESFKNERRTAQPDYNPYGKPGNGAPLLAEDGNVKGALKRNFYNDALDWLQLHERDTAPKVAQRVDYRDELDSQRSEYLAPKSSAYNAKQTHQKDALMATMSHSRSDKTNGLSLPLSSSGSFHKSRRGTSGEYYAPIPKTDVVMRPHNYGQLMQIHPRSDEDYQTYNGMAFGRPGAGAPVLDPLSPSVIDAHLKGVHTPIKVYHGLSDGSRTNYQSTYQSTYQSAANSTYASARNSLCPTPTAARSRSQSVSDNFAASLTSAQAQPKPVASGADGLGKSLLDIAKQLHDIEQTSRALQLSVDSSSLQPLSRNSFAYEHAAKSSNGLPASGAHTPLAPVRVTSGGGYAQAYASKLRSRSSSVNASSFNPSPDYVAHKPTPFVSQRHSRQGSVSSALTTPFNTGGVAGQRNSYVLPRL